MVGTIVFVGCLLCALIGGIAGWLLRDYFAERDQER